MRDTLIFSVIALLFFSVFLIGSDRNEIVECNKWQQQAKEYPNFYLTKWQDDQCKAHDIVIQAQVEVYKK